MTLSIIIPVYKEGEGLIQTIDHLQKIKGNHPLEIIVVDGDEKNSAIEHRSNSGVITIKSHKGRAAQMNRGADSAGGDVLLFLHADTILPANAFDKITTVMRSGKYVGGAFCLEFDNRGWAFKLIAMAATLRSRITRIPFGDQAIFMKRAYFQKIGCYADIPLMEDVELMQRIKKNGDKIHIVPARAVTSARKWEKEGLLVTTLRNWLLQLLYFAGVSPDRLVNLYYS